jgi:hypothetical protein
MKYFISVLFILFITAFVRTQAQSTVSPDTVCAGSVNKIFDVDPTPGSSYVWILRNGSTYGSISTIAGRSDSIRINFGASAGIDTLKLVEIGPSGCLSDTVKMAIVIMPATTATIVGTDSICVNNVFSANRLRIVFTGTSPWNVTYTDGTTPVTISSITSSPYYLVSPVYSVTGVKNYTLVSANSNGSCPASLSGSASVTVFPKPTPSAIKHY